MAHFAKLDENNIVIEVNVVNNDVLDPNNEEQSGIQFLTQWSGGHSNWRQTSYNGNFRKRYAGRGFKYDESADVFIAPQPFPSWTLDENYDWQPPKQKPAGRRVYWDEDLGDWVNAETL